MDKNSEQKIQLIELLVAINKSWIHHQFNQLNNEFNLLHKLRNLSHQRISAVDENTSKILQKHCYQIAELL